MGASCASCGKETTPPHEINNEKLDSVRSQTASKADPPDSGYCRQLSSKTVKRRSSHKTTQLRRDFRTQASHNLDELQNIETFTEDNSSNRMNAQVSLVEPLPIQEASAFLQVFEQECLAKAVEVLYKKEQEKKTVLRSSMVMRNNRSIRNSDFGNPLAESNVKIRMDSGFVRILQKNINDSYKFLQKLGEGSFGSVHKAVCLKSHQERAIKIVRKGKCDMQKMLFGELDLLKTLDHPNIIKLFEIYDHKEFLYVVTEYCDGGELFAAVKLNHHFSERDASVIMKQLLSAVNYMHSRHIVHRDLKPENIVFQSVVGTNLSDGKIKIIDFGTAEVVKKGKNLTARVGSPFYVAPEVLLHSYNIKCDIWSCGIILYVLLCGYPPFRGRSHEEIFANIAKAPLSFEGKAHQNVDKAWKNISKQAKALVRTMLDRNVSRRISAQEALNNPWIQQCSHTQPIGEDTLLNMEQFFFKNKFVAVIETYLANNAMSQSERTQLAEKFKSIDKDGNGTLEKSELIEAYKSIYGMVDEAAIIQIIDTIDINGSGKVDFTEFIVATSNRQKLFQRRALQQAFDFFDSDKTGFIEANELRELLGNSCDNDQLALIMGELDDNGDHQISKEEFVAKLLPQN